MKQNACIWKKKRDGSNFVDDGAFFSRGSFDCGCRPLWGSIRLFHNVSEKNGITFTSIDCHKEDVERYISENTRAICIETPTNPMMNVTDIEALGKIAQKHKLLLIVDNTFLSPYSQNLLDLGVDIVVHSGTKYLGGHNDTLAGFLVTNREDISESKRWCF